MAAERWFAELLEAERERWRERLAEADDPEAAPALRRKLEAQRRRFKRELELSRARFEQQAQETARLERRLEQSGERLQRVSARVARTERYVAETGAPERPANAGPIDLATASRDELRSVGFSVTQAKRLLRCREAGTFRSIDDLDEVPGLPREFRQQLLRQFHRGTAPTT